MPAVPWGTTAGVLPRPHHGRLHVDVPIQEPRRYSLSGGVDHLRALADAVVGLPYVGDPPFGDGHVDALLDFGRAHVHEVGTLDDHVGRLFALRHRGERLRAFPERFLAEMIEHGTPPSPFASIDLRMRPSYDLYGTRGIRTFVNFPPGACAGVRQA